MSSPSYMENYEPQVKMAGGVQTKLPIKLTVPGSSTSAWVISGTGAPGTAGTPSATAPQGTLYLRTDGSSTSTRAYIATNNTGTYTAITTAA